MSYRECNATSKRTHEKCRARAVEGSDKCYHHGGVSLKGAAHPSFIDGSTSKYYPKQLLTVFETTQQDPELGSVRKKMAFIEALILIKTQSLFDEQGERHGDAFTVWKKLKDLVASCRIAYKSENYAGLEDALDKMNDIADARMYRYETEIEIKDDVERWRKLAETEQKINLQGERAIPIEGFMILMAQILDVIKTVVTDDKQRFTIASELERLLSVPKGIEVSS